MMPADFDAAAAVILSWLLTYAIHSTILLAAAAVAAWRFADRHAWVDLIWKAALVGPLLTASLHLDPFAVPLGGRWAMPNVTTVSSKPISTPAPDSVSPPHHAGKRVMGAPRETPSSPPTVQRVMSPPAVDRSAESETAVRRWPLVGAVVWLLIAIVAVVRYGVRLRGVYRALRSGVPVTAADLIDTLDGLRTRANQRRPIRLTTSPVCPVPLALAGRQIVLPDRFLRELDSEQQRAALAHELAHVARRDPEWRIAVEILERALFFQPLNRLARARLCDSAEFLCDEWAVQQTQSPLALARCLSVIASWWSPATELPAGASAMARSDSQMVQRVTRILNEPARVASRPRLLWLAIPVTLVAVFAPRVTAARLPAAVTVTPPAAAVVSSATAEKDLEQRPAEREWTAADIANARAQLRVYRPARPGDAFEQRWQQAIAEAARLRLTDFWMVYTFNTPTHADDVILSDTRDGGSFVSSSGRFFTEGPPLTDLFSPGAVPLEGGNLAVLLHYRGARADAIDRAGYRSVQLGFDFGRTPVFWLGEAPESQSFERVRGLFDQTHVRDIQEFLIDLASLHSNTNVVAPFLTRLLDPSSWPSEIRGEAAEGFEHHHDPRSVEILLRVARTDPDSSVRAEAAEAIGAVQVAESIPALTDLANESPDAAVRHEAAEAFADQPAARALPAIERLIATSEDDDVVSEAIEALGDIEDPGVLALLVQTANGHPRRSAQIEAVETIGDIDDAAAMAALEKIAREHDREEVQAEAIETIADRSEQSLHPVILELAVSGNSARIRREALDQIGDAVGKTGDTEFLDRAQQAIERAIFDDPDQSVRMEALDALDELPDERALGVLRDVIARHPDARVRREAEEHVRERRQ